MALRAACHHRIMAVSGLWKFCAGRKGWRSSISFLHLFSSKLFLHPLFVSFTYRWGEGRIMRNNREIRNDGKMILKHNAGIIIGTQPIEVIHLLPLPCYQFNLKDMKKSMKRSGLYTSHSLLPDPTIQVHSYANASFKYIFVVPISTRSNRWINPTFSSSGYQVSPKLWKDF